MINITKLPVNWYINEEEKAIATAISHSTNDNLITDVTPTREQSSVIKLPLLSHCSWLCDVSTATFIVGTSAEWQFCYLHYLIYPKIIES